MTYTEKMLTAKFEGFYHVHFATILDRKSCKISRESEVRTGSKFAVHSVAACIDRKIGHFRFRAFFEKCR